MTFAYHPVYLPGTPSRLPAHELLLGLSRRFSRFCRFCLRVRCVAALGSPRLPRPASAYAHAHPAQTLLVLCVWMGAVPLATCWLWRLVFAPSLSAGSAMILRRCSPLLLLTDCLYGSVLSAGIVFTILAVSSLRDHLRAVRRVPCAHATRRVPLTSLTDSPLPLSVRSCASQLSSSSPRASPPRLTPQTPQPPRSTPTGPLGWWRCRRWRCRRRLPAPARSSHLKNWLACVVR